MQLNRDITENIFFKKEKKNIIKSFQNQPKTTQILEKHLLLDTQKMAPKALSSSSSKKSSASTTSSGSTAPVKAPKPPKFFIARPTPSLKGSKHATKIYFSEDVLKLIQINSGDIVYVSRFEESTNGVLGIAAVAEGSGVLNVAQLSRSLRRLGGFYLGDKLLVEKVKYQVSYAKRALLAIKPNKNLKEESTAVARVEELSEKFKVKVAKFLNDVGVIMPGLELPNIDLVNDSNEVVGNVDVKVLYIDYEPKVENGEYCYANGFAENKDEELPDILRLSITDNVIAAKNGIDDDEEGEEGEEEEEEELIDEAEEEAEDVSAKNNQRLVSPARIIDRSNTKLDYTIITGKQKFATIPSHKYTNLPQLPKFNSVGGLQHELSLIKSLVRIPLNNPKVFRYFHVKPSRGILLYGPSGTGKTMILNNLQNEFFNSVHMIRINGPSIISKYLGDAELKLKEIFNEARLYQPSMILIDEIDSLLPNRGAASGDSADEQDANDNRIIATLLTLMDNMEDSCRVMIVGATNRPNNIDVSLRRPGRFDKEIEIGIPDVNARLDILTRLFKRQRQQNGTNDFQKADIMLIASKTHGYVGADLVALCREAVMVTIQRGGYKVTMGDVETALNEIRPSAMREIFLEMPKVYWNDIGGQEELKQKLKEMVQLPLEAADTFKALGVNAPKGVLLYGPPGCSKTLTAKALATESGLNFLAVKGPEIFNKYVGESERSIREIFRKARAASPSIIFFDEIDALSPDRMDDGGASSTSASGHVLTTLLNEIDGVEELNGVIIVGATNKPGSIDAALLRPGRLDRHIYVGPPDYLGRLKILEMKTKAFQLEKQYLEEVAKRLEGFSGAEVVLVCQEAGIAAIMENQETDKVEKRHFEQALAGVKRGITEDMLEYYNSFKEGGR